MAASSRPGGSSSSSRCSGRRSPSRWSAPGDGRSTRPWTARAEAEASGVSGRPFLTARWRHLLLLNYEVDPGLLEPLVPSGTELDAWEGRTLMSLLGFRFLDTAVLGVPVPGHRQFTEVNLRFYVRPTELEEVVAIAYGSAERGELSGAVAAVPGDQVGAAPVTSFDEALLGRAAGVD